MGLAWEGLGPLRLGALGPNPLNYPGKDNAFLSWIISLHHAIGAVLPVEDFLALPFVITHRYRKSVIEIRSRPVRKERTPIYPSPLPRPAL
jgi:hypothetical protein